MRGLMCACSSVHVGVAIGHFSFQTLSSKPAGAATLQHVTGGVITQLLLLALTTTSPPTWRAGGGANGVGCEGRGQEVCRVLPFSPLCPGLEPASMGILPVWISVCAIFILTSCEEQRIPEGEWVSPVLRTVPGSQEPRPGLCWIELDLQSCQTEKLFRQQEKVAAVLP